MGNTFRVHVINSLQNLSNDICSFAFRISSTRNNLVKQLTTCYSKWMRVQTKYSLQFKNKINGVIRFVNLLQGDDVWTGEFVHDINLSLE